jgi:Zn-dependent peptidase ImmA (M78 family)
MSMTSDSPLAGPRWGLAKSTADQLTKNISVPPVPVLEIAERSGVDVVFIDFEDLDEAVAGYCDFEQECIFVNMNDQPTRQTFTMAHELGHWILHRQYYLSNPEKYPVLPRYGSPDNTNPMEKEANHFAAHLLVPDRLLKPVIDAPVTKLARVFMVSRLMMEYRVATNTGTRACGRIFSCF